MHLCNDEFQVVLAFFQSLPFVGHSRLVLWLKERLAKRQPHCCDERHREEER